MLNLNRLKNPAPLNKNDCGKNTRLIIFSTLFATASFTFNISCGKRRPPLPPSSNRVVNQNNFLVAQQGNKIVISIPLVNKMKDSFPQQIQIFRLAESTNSPAFLTEDEFASRSTQVGSIQLTAPPKENEALFFDTVTPTVEPRRLRYAVRFVNRDNHKSAFSNFIFFEPIANVAESPALDEPVVTQAAIKLKWQAPLKNIDETQPVNVIGYNIYRRAKQPDIPKRLNASPLSSAEFEDKFFIFGEEYEYFVRAISNGVNGIQIESADSNAFKIIARDVFPPSAPEGLTIAAAPGNLSVFFAAGTASDVVGYNIFRSTNPETKPESWQKLNDTPISSTAFQDVKVESGQRYYYYVTAVDSAGNVSQPSEIVSEVAP